MAYPTDEQIRERAYQLDYSFYSLFCFFRIRAIVAEANLNSLHDSASHLSHKLRGYRG